MATVFRLPGGGQAATDDDPIWVGTDAACAVRLPEDGRVQPRHARVRRTAGRWLVESLGDWPVQVGSGPPSRLGWLKPGDVIRLSASGPDLVFQPAAAAVPQTPPAASESGLDDDLTLDGGSPPPRGGPPPLPGASSPPRKGPPPLPDSAGPPRKGPPPLPS